MPKRVLSVEVVGDAGSLRKTLRGASGDVSKFGKSADQAGGRVRKLIPSFATVAKVSTAAGVAAGAAGAKLIGLASDAEETASKFKTVFGRETKAATKELNAFSKATGTSKFALREQAAQLQALVKPMGTGAKESAKMSVGLTKLATDLASFNNSSVDEAIVALQSGLVGEAEPLRRFGVQLSAARVQAFAYAKGIAKTGEDLTAAQKAQASYGIIMRDTKLAQGDAVRTSDSFANSFKRLKSQVGDAATELGVKLLPAATTAVGAVSGFISQMSAGTGAGGQFVDTVRGIALALGDATSAVSGFITSTPGLAAVGAIVGGLTTRFVALNVAMGVSRVMAWVGGIQKAGGAMVALNAIVRANPIGIIATVVGAAAGALGLMSLKTDDAKVSAQQLTDAWRAQADAARALRDIDIDVAQRRANVQSASVAVESAERRLTQARKESGKGSLAAKQAEADLRQARIQAKRASRDLGDAEDDGRRKREDAITSTKNAGKATRDRIATLRDEIRGMQGVKKWMDEDSAAARALTAKQKELRLEIARLKSKKVTVDVQLDLRPPSGIVSGGDGWGVESAVQAMAQNAFNTGKLGAGPLMGGSGLNAFNSIASQFGLSIGSGFRPGSITSSGNLSYHAMGRARDFPGSAGEMMAFARYMASAYGSVLKELIYTPLGFSIKNGAQVAPYAQADHYDHVHVAMRRGGTVGGRGSGDTVPTMLTPGEEIIRAPVAKKIRPLLKMLNAQRLASGGTVARAAMAAGFKGADLLRAVAESRGESSWKERAVGDGGASLGLMQIHKPSHPWAAALNLFNPGVNMKAAYKIWKSSGWGAWHADHTPWIAAAKAAIASVTGKGGKGKQTKAKRLASTPAKGRRTTGEIVGTQQDDRHTRRWEGLEGIRDDEVVTPGERKKATRAYSARAKVLNSRIKKKRARLRTINAALKGKLKPATRKRLLAENATLVSDIGGLMGELRSITGEFQSLVAPFDAGDTGGGVGEPDTSAADAVRENTQMLKELKESIDKQNAYAASASAVGYAQAIRFIGDILSGQVAGHTMARGRSAGDGVTGATY